MTVTLSTKCRSANKLVHITKYANGYGWGNKKIVDVVHDCILARYLGAGVNDPTRILENRIKEEIRMDFSELTRYDSAIHTIDNSEGEDTDLQLMRELAKKLEMRVLLHQ